MRASIRLAAIALAIAAAALARAEPLRVMGFGGSSNWALFAAQERGFFRREGLEVDLLSAPGSAEQMRRLMDGRIDIALTALDNVVAYREGQAAAPEGADRDVVAVFGVNRGGRSTLVAAPRIKAIAEFEGQPIGVDALATGYAFVVEEMLARAGLARDRYRLVSVGGGRARWHALREGKVAAALLNAPLDAAAQAAGFRALASSGEMFPHYQGSVGAVRRTWARAHEEALVRFIRAYIAATDWLRDPANAAAAQAILVSREERMTAPQARRSYEELLDPAGGSLSPRAAIDPEGMETVLRLRSAHARPPRPMGPPDRYYDPAYYRRAAAPTR